MMSSTASVARAIRLSILDHSWRANVGHIGSCLSIADILAVLYAEILDLPALDDPERDRFVLSKGHAALAVYAALAATGRLDPGELATYCADGSLLAGHPEHALAGVDFTTGSLGQGLSVAGGAALAAKLRGSRRRAFALVSDAECNEGSLWEAVMFAAHHRLSNLVAIVDLNGQQALGYTSDVLDLGPMARRWKAFGWDVHEVDGHDHEELAGTLRGLPGIGAPHVVIAHTTFGKGVSYMENEIAWHYWPMSDEQHRQAVDEVQAVALAARDAS
jgi:transketolase